MDPNPEYFVTIHSPALGGNLSSPLAVGLGGFVARQAADVVDAQAGRAVGLERQRGEPVEGHEGEEPCVVNWVLVSAGQAKTNQVLS